MPQPELPHRALIAIHGAFELEFVGLHPVWNLSHHEWKGGCNGVRFGPRSPGIGHGHRLRSPIPVPECPVAEARGRLLQIANEKNMARKSQFFITMAMG